MNPIVRNILAVVAGVLLGSVVNMGLIQISGAIIPPVSYTHLDVYKRQVNPPGPDHAYVIFVPVALVVPSSWIV